MKKYRSQKIDVIPAFDNDPGRNIYIPQFHERYSGEEITIDFAASERKGMMYFRANCKYQQNREVYLEDAKNRQVLYRN